jgi:hypothetical protein
MRWRELRAFAICAWRMTVKHPELRSHYWGTIFDCMRSNPSSLRGVVLFASIYLDIGQSSRHVVSTMRRQIEAIDRGEWVPFARPTQAMVS